MTQSTSQAGTYWYYTSLKSLCQGVYLHNSKITQHIGRQYQQFPAWLVLCVIVIHLVHR